MTKPNLETASKALQGLAKNPGALKSLDVALTAFKHDLGVSMNDTTFHYVLNAVINQKVVDGVDPVGSVDKVALPGEFQIVSAVKLSPIAR